MTVDRMTLRRSRSLPGGRRVGGAFVEAVDAAGNVLYRHEIDDPTRPSVEIFEPGRIRRADVSYDEVTIDVLVPDVDELAQVRIVVDGRALPFREGHGAPGSGGYDAGAGGGYDVPGEGLADG
jgi:hypothetical protein